MGPDCLSVAMSLFADNRRRLCEKLKEEGTVSPGAMVVLQGGEQECLHSSDREIVFRQVPWRSCALHESWFIRPNRSRISTGCLV
jgi:hypothetical protein